jgi:hypothetical protein
MSRPDARAVAIAVALSSSTSNTMERSSALMTRRSAAIAAANGRSPPRTARRSTLSPFRTSARGAASHPVGTAMAQVDIERRCANEVLAAASSAEREGPATRVEMTEAPSSAVPTTPRRSRRRDAAIRLGLKVRTGSILVRGTRRGASSRPVRAAPRSSCRCMSTGAAPRRGHRFP